MTQAFGIINSMMKKQNFDDHAKKNNQHTSYLKSINGKSFAEVLDEENKKREMES